MKARIATVLSLTGVLVAGSAAALVNTQVLASENTGGGKTVTTLTADSAATGPAAQVLDTSLPTTTSAPPLTQAIYQIGDSGMVTLDTAGDVLTIVAVSPTAGWEVVGSESKDPTNAEVVFMSGPTVIDFKANLLLGIVSTSVESMNLDLAGGYGSPSADDSGSQPHTTGGGVTTTQPARTIVTTATTTATTPSSHESDDSHHSGSEPSDD